MAESESNTAVVEEQEVEQKGESRRKAEPKDSGPKPKKQPPYAVVVLNDDEHTYEYVIEVLQKTFGYDARKCYLMALQVDLTGRAVVWTGPMETAEFKRDRIRSFGADFYARKPVTWPLGCLIEPVPQ